MSPVELSIPDVVTRDQPKTLPPSLLAGAPIIIDITAYYTRSPHSNVCINPTGMRFSYVKTDSLATATSISVEFWATGLIKDNNGDSVGNNDPVGGYNEGGFATYTVTASAAMPVEAQVYSAYRSFPGDYYIWVIGVGTAYFQVYGSVSTTSGMKSFNERVYLAF